MARPVLWPAAGPFRRALLHEDFPCDAEGHLPAMPADSHVDGPLVQAFGQDFDLPTGPKVEVVHHAQLAGIPVGHTPNGHLFARAALRQRPVGRPRDLARRAWYGVA